MIDSEISLKWLESLKEPNGKLKKIQENGRKNFYKINFPSNKDEDWRLININNLKSFLRVSKPKESKAKFKEQYPILKTTLKNIYKIELDPSNNLDKEKSLPKGIEKLTQSELDVYLGKAINDCKRDSSWPILLNESSANQVIGLKVKGNSLPIIEIVIPAIEDSVSSTRLIIKVEENTNLDLVQVILGSKDSAQSNLTEIIASKNSHINHGLIALGGGDASLLSNLAITQEVSSEYSFTFLQEGWRFSRLEPSFLQNSGGAKTTLKGLQISSKSQEICTHTWVRFNGPEGELDQLNKASAKDNSHTSFNGVVQVPRAAQKTKASQLSRNLMLSKRAKIDTKPELEIIADDVRCTHGATVSQLQEDELFYLMSRGIGSKQANKLLLEGYYKEILTGLPLYEDRWSFLNNLITENSK
ncbi:Fe-S cluster assembly protein SufD [Prochlorococcus sp. MIT 1223]|uniref:Fe-S cluster assembly protein SufD n=1 Tax=Prochlorococcus sp. MIT 1223 TaxID=3096217 RepID=UPI002A748C6F|nr:Fe-S cluster assembly protein SufD [Prochlorococcus sp. MIT 1223]